MKRLLRLKSLLIAGLLFTGLANTAEASHFQGGDLTYQCVAPGIYVINAKIYRDCTGATAPTSITLDLKPQGCAGGRSVNVNRTGLPTIGNPYCPQIPQTCSTVRANYEEVRFSTTVTFTAAEQACAGGMIVSCTNSARPEIANLVNPQGNIYAEAFINLAAGINNSSPEFSPLNVPIPFVCVGQDTRYSLNAAEQDGDSLFYELAAPLSAANTPYTYAPISGGPGGYFENPNPKPPYCNTCTPRNPQLGYFAGGATTFTPTYPLPSYNANWTAIPPGATVPPQIVPAYPYFDLYQSGELRFRPAVYVASPPVQGKNKYAVVVKISEYREIPANSGTWVKVGHIRRDILFIVEDCGGNTLPSPDPQPLPSKFNATLTADSIYTIQTCNTTPIRLNFVDPDTADELTVTVNPADLAKIPNSQWTLAGNGTDHVTALLYITPAVSAEGDDYLLPIKIEDNSCPIKGTQNQVIRIHVMKRDLAFVVGNQTRTICRGESAKLEVDVNRPDSLMTPLPVVATSTNQPTTYTYQWDLAPGLNPADLNNKIVNVKPTVTTRYHLRVNSTFTGCYDTASVLVKVQELPDIQDIQVAYPAGTSQVRFGSAVKLTPVIGGDTTGYTYLWSPAKTLYTSEAAMELDSLSNDSTSFNVWAAPLRDQTYTLKVFTADGMCFSERTVVVNVGLPFLPNVITPNGDGKNDFFEFKALQPGTNVKIYNRWGVLVQEFKDYKNEFDGKNVSDGTYYYFIKETSGKTFKGFFDIVH